VLDFAKPGAEYCSYDIFSKLTPIAIKAGKTFDVAVEVIVNAVLRYMPREIDYLAKLEDDRLQLNLNDFRSELVGKLVMIHSMAAGAVEDMAAASGVRKHMGELLDSYGFPRYMIDVASFSADLVQAARISNVEDRCLKRKAVQAAADAAEAFQSQAVAAASVEVEKLKAELIDMKREQIQIYEEKQLERQRIQIYEEKDSPDSDTAQSEDSMGVLSAELHKQEQDTMGMVDAGECEEPVGGVGAVHS